MNPRLRRLARLVLLAITLPTALVCASLVTAGTALAGDWTEVPFPQPYSSGGDKCVERVARDSQGGTWAATNDDKVFVLRAQASRWEKATEGLPAALGSHERLYVDGIFAYGDKVYLTANNSLFMRPLSGEKWRLVSSYNDRFVVSLLPFDGYLWDSGAGTDGVQRMDPATDHFEDVSAGLPVIGFNSNAHARLSEPAATGDHLYVGISTDQHAAGAAAAVRVYRLRQSSTKWEDTGLRVRPAAAERDAFATVPSDVYCDWGVTRVWASGDHVMCEVACSSGAELDFTRLYVLDEAAGSWSELLPPDPKSHPALQDVFLAVSDGHWGDSVGVTLYPPDPSDGRFFFVAEANRVEGRATTAVYDPATHQWTSGSLPIEEWPAASSTLYSGIGYGNLFPVLDGRLIVSAIASTGHTSSTSGFVASVPLPTQVSRDPAVIGTNIVLAFVFAIGFGFTSMLFNRTVRENHDDLVRAFAPIAGAAARLAAPIRDRFQVLVRRRSAPITEEAVAGASLTRAAVASRARGLLQPLLLVVLAAFIYGFVDPNFGLSSKGLTLYLSLLISIAFVTYAYEGIQSLYSSRRLRVAAGLRFYPVALLIAVVCVVFSRAVGFSPGYVYGFVGSIAFVSGVRPKEALRGRMVFAGGLVLLTVSVGAWFLAVPITHAVESHGGWLLGVLQGAAIGVFVAGLEGLCFDLVPLSFLDGESLWRWNKWVWLGTWATVAFMFWHVLLNKDSAYLATFGGRNVRVMVGLLMLFVLVTLGTHLHFSRKRRRITRSAAGEERSEVTIAPSPTALPAGEAQPASTVAGAPAGFAATVLGVSPTAEVLQSSAPVSVERETAAAACFVSATGTKTCLACGETIKAEARLCRFCRARFRLRRSGYCAACHAMVVTDESLTCPLCGAAVLDPRIETLPADTALSARAIEGAVTAERVAPARTAPAITDTLAKSSRASARRWGAARSAVLLGKRGRPRAASAPLQPLAIVAGLSGIVAGCGLFWAWGMPWYEQTEKYALFYENPPWLIGCGVLLVIVGIVTVICQRRRAAVFDFGVVSVLVGGVAVYVTVTGRSTLADAGVGIDSVFRLALGLSALAVVPGVLACIASIRMGGQEEVAILQRLWKVSRGGRLNEVASG
jgi:hypothetical protein